MGFISKFKSMIGQQINDADTASKFKSLTNSQAHVTEPDAYNEPKRISLIRAREFDQLRAVLLKNGASSSLEITDTTFDKNRLNKVRHPAKTLKKIDEIEVEMSKLWWKTVRLDLSKGKSD